MPSLPSWLKVGRFLPWGWAFSCSVQPIDPCMRACKQVSSVELERACVEGVPSVLEAAAVGLPGPGGGPEQLVLFLVPKQAASRCEQPPHPWFSACPPFLTLKVPEKIYV